MSCLAVFDTLVFFKGKEEGIEGEGRGKGREGKKTEECVGIKRYGGRRKYEARDKSRAWEVESKAK